MHGTHLAFLVCGLLCVGLAATAGSDPAANTVASSSPRARDASSARSLGVAEAAPVPSPRVPSAPGGSQEGRDLSAETQNRVIGRFCLRCHNDDLRTGGMTLESFDVDAAAEHPELAEKVVRKLQAGMMPPPEARRPDRDTVTTLVAALTSRLDEAYGVADNPGGRTFQRLNRAEYERSVADLLDLEIDAGVYLPPDTVSAGFDNIADVQGLSTTVMEGYLSAASEISRLAVGDPTASPGETTYEVPRYVSQRERVDGAPFGTRGGISVAHAFPADGEYVFTIHLYDAPVANLYGKTTYHDEQLEISIDGERVALLNIDRWMDADNEYVQSDPVFLRSGQRRLTAAFLKKADGPVPDLLSPHDWSIADKDIGSAYGVTTLPHLRDLAIAGPYNASGVSETASRRRVFSCRPTSPDEESECAEAILSRLATDAYRRALNARDVEALMAFYDSGAAAGGFEGGVRAALEAILASPHFVFRFEQPAADPSPSGARITDAALASRLSFFLWGGPPDEELIALARERRLSEPAVLDEQMQRMLADPRAEALATRFAAQWLRLQDLDKAHPDALSYPDYDQQLADAMRRETELFFYDFVREDRSLLDLLDADFTYVNAKLARHYGLAGVTGEHFRRVELPPGERRGLLGQGSILTMTSHANRTSPVLRGKWVMVALLGSPPPPPPPGVPELEETDEAVGTRLLSVRERLEEHRSNPACSSCHRVIDPIGLALENFGVTGEWRIKDNEVPVDVSGEFYDGGALGSPADLRAALLRYSEAFVTTFTENLMSYALGRRIEHTDMPAVRTVVRSATAADHRLSAFIRGVVASPAFRYNDRLAPQPTDDAAERDRAAAVVRESRPRN